MFTVLWTPAAEQQLTAILLTATDSAAVLKAARSLDRKLRRDPLTVGESRGSSVERIVFAEPLGITFSVIVDDATVYVTAVWAIR
jgi:hypothetical protein